jgi:CheY-like chemotaxis protein
MNLGVNARDAMAGSGQLFFGANNVTVDEALALSNPGAHVGPHVRLTVSDTGGGIPPELLDRIFDPFFTTKVAGKGTGLGLSTVLGIVKGHGGFLQVHSELGRGSEFSLYFPAVMAQTEMPAGRPVVAAPPPGRGETILVIDDERAMREISRSFLESQGFHVLVAETGAVGLALYHDHRDAIRVVLTDMMLPGMQGAEVIRELRALNADVRVVAMSGADGEQSGVSKESGRLVFLAKPMSGDELVCAIRTVLAVPGS